VRTVELRPYAALPALCLCCCALPLLAGCSLYNSLFHHSHDHGCTERPFQGNTETLPGLTVPQDMTPPDPRNQVKIPSLNEPERVRLKTEPCLAQPPSYASGSSIALPTRSGTPMGQPAPAPLPTSPTEPVAPYPESPSPATPVVTAPGPEPAQPSPPTPEPPR
jgi:hypothetical protein